jgi:hypothetical protein
MTQTYPWTKEEVQSVKAAWASDAGRVALTIIVERLANIHGASFSNNPLEMAFNEGARFIGRELMAAINQPVEKIVKEPDEPHSRTRVPTGTERAERTAAERAAGTSAIGAASKRLARARAGL